FQAEDGIRDFHVTGVQTCALPIYFLMSQREYGFEFSPKIRIVLSWQSRQVVELFANQTLNLWLNVLALKNLAAHFVHYFTVTIEIGRASCRDRVERSVSGGSVMNA